MGREEKRREVDGAALEGGDSKPVSKFFFVGKNHFFNFLNLMSAMGSSMKRILVAHAFSSGCI